MGKTGICRALAVLCVLALVLSAAGCETLNVPAKDRSVSDRTLYAMDTEMTLRLYGDTDGACMEELAALLEALDGRLSATSEGSSLSALNRTGETSDGELLSIVTQAKAIHDRTGGALDLSLYPASLAWGFTTGSYHVPAPEDLEALRPSVGMDKLTVGADNLELAQGMMLDLGAVGKGWAADRCREAMEARGLSGILSLGGSIQTVGTKPDGSDWVIGVQDPDDAGAYLLTLTLKGTKAVVTSGDYQRYFEEGGVRYCHILDPDTLSPVHSSLRSVTVVADSGFLADGLATALFVLGKEAGIALYRQSSDFEAIWIEEGGVVTVTPGLKDLVSGCEFEAVP